MLFAPDQTTSPLLASRENSAFDLQVERGKTSFITDQEDTSPFKADGKNLVQESSGSYMRTMFYFRYALVTQEEALCSLKWCQEAPPLTDDWGLSSSKQFADLRPHSAHTSGRALWQENAVDFSPRTWLAVSGVSYRMGVDLNNRAPTCPNCPRSSSPFCYA